jgi:hypothetical protein
MERTTVVIFCWGVEKEFIRAVDESRDLRTAMPVLTVRDIGSE